jgi:hypothetical protein
METEVINGGHSVVAELPVAESPVPGKKDKKKKKAKLGKDRERYLSRC